ncbi:RILP-like protein homolog isoform X2 [Dermacentor andersoni]|uniref:RILP-like protein homolog isoform X2 n=1 Tax=Dermacentor andersoni TaxID=34620 RepID=UPI0021556684|nr:RILP-like protein homolog isoform X2 [Dermacentor andersoni]
MERASEALSVDDVYSLAEEIGKEFEILIDNYGVEPVNKLVTKVIRVLEYLEAYATKNDIARNEIAELRAQIYQLEHDKYEKAESRSKLEKEMEQYEDIWRQEMKDLGVLVARLQEENSKLSSSLKERESHPSLQCEPHSVTLGEDIVVLERLRDAFDKQGAQLRHNEKDMAKKAADIESLQQQLEASKKAAQEQSRRNRRLQQQMRQLCEERGDLQVQLQDQQSQLQTLQERLGIAVKDHDDILQSRDAALDMQGKVVIDLDDPNRPRFTLEELKHILFERNELKARVSDLEDELALYRPRPVDPPSPVRDEDRPVQGPINQEPEEKLFSYGKASGIRKFFQYVMHNLQMPGEEPRLEILPERFSFPSVLWPRVKPG